MQARLTYGNWMPLVIIGSLFFVFGFITWLNGALIPFLQIVCQLGEIQAMLIAFSFYIAYVVMALPMSYILEKSGYKNAMSIGLGLIAAGCLLFIPAAKSQAFSIFLFAQFVVGSGLTILQTASNPYLVKVGPQESAAARISIMGLLNKGAGVLAPIIFTFLILGEFEGISAKTFELLSPAEQASQITIMSDNLILPYLGMAIALSLLAVALRFSDLPELDLEHEAQSLQVSHSDKTSVLHFPHLILGVVTLFFYVGVEVIAGDTIGLLGSGLGVENATSLTSFTMFFMVMGYLLGLFLTPRFISQKTLLIASALSGIAFSICVIYSNPAHFGVSEMLWGWLGIQTIPNTVAFVALLGLSNAIVWPAVWPLALQNLGYFTAKGSALLIMGIAGGAILPMVFGVLSSHYSPIDAYWMMVPCYLFILFYGIKGCSMTTWRRA